MAITINGSTNAIGGLAVGGLPDGTIDADALAADCIDESKIANNGIDSEHYNAGSVDLSHLSATGTASSSTFLRGDNAWAAAGGGKVVKHAFQTYDTSANTSSTSFVDTGLTIDYSPVAASNIVYVICMQQCYMGSSGNGDARSQFQLLESSTVLALTQFESSSFSSPGEVVGVETLVGKFTAAGTSAVTIKTQYKKVSGGTPYAQHGSRASNLLIIEVEP